MKLRKNLLRKTGVLLLAVLLLTSLAACKGSTSQDASDNNRTESASSNTVPKEIRIGYWASPNSEIIVKQTGSLQASYPDVKVTWIEFTSGADILTAIQSDSIDMATIGTPPGTTGIANGYNFHVYYIEDIIGESEGLIVRNDSGISSLKELKGKKNSHKLRYNITF